MNPDVSIFVLSQNQLPFARQIQHSISGQIYGLASRVEEENIFQFNSLSEELQAHYKKDKTIIALMAPGIVIRALAPMLISKHNEPPVLAISADGGDIIPLLGLARGGDELAKQLSYSLSAHIAGGSIGVSRFGIHLLNPPAGLELCNPQDGMRFIANLLEQQKVRIDGYHKWLQQSRLPATNEAALKISVLSAQDPIIAGDSNHLVYRNTSADSKRGSVSVIGIGPGDHDWRTIAANKALNAADDILGYDFYIDLAGPFRPIQVLHKSDNRQELDRARHALELAKKGRDVALVSSGDSGIFGMNAALMEVLEQEGRPAHVDIQFFAGITAAQAAAARTGAPLGHDFAIVSLSDNLKPWDIIEKRLIHLCQADMIIALYNPVSKSRRQQLPRAFDILRTHKPLETPVIIATDIAREQEKIIYTTLQNINLDDVTSRSTVIIGSSQSHVFSDHVRQWFYTSRRYPTSL